MINLIRNDLADHILNLMRRKDTGTLLMRHLLREGYGNTFNEASVKGDN